MSGLGNIVVITSQFSVVVKSIEKKIEEMGFNVSTVDDDPDGLTGFMVSTSLFVVYLPTDIHDFKKKERLVRLSNVVSQSKRPLLLIGEHQHYDDVMALSPDMNKAVWMDRPLNMDKFEEAVVKIIESNDIFDTEKKGILIVDDDPSYARMVKDWIKDDYKVDIVTDGMQAIAFLLKKKVKLILLDYEMPVVDGPQVFQMLRSEPSTAGIPVVFLTGVSTKEGVSRVMQLKPNGYILKSTTRDDLLNYISGLKIW